MLDDKMELIENNDHVMMEMDNAARTNVTIPIPASIKGEWRVRAVAYCAVCCRTTGTVNPHYTRKMPCTTMDGKAMLFLRRRIISEHRRLVNLREELANEKAAAKWRDIIGKAEKAMEARLWDLDERANRQP